MPAALVAQFEQLLTGAGVDDAVAPGLLDGAVDLARAVVEAQTRSRNGSAPAATAAATAPVPPHDLDAEESVLGGLMIGGNVTEVSAVVRAGDFYRPSHGHVFRAIVALHGRGEPVDAITVVAELERHGKLTDAHGAERVHELAALVPAAANAPHYGRRVAELARRRRLSAVLARTHAEALDLAVDVDDALTLARTALESDEIDGLARQAQPFTGLTHDAALREEISEDRYLIDGLIPAGTVGVIAGVPEVGKSWIAQAIAVRCARGAGEVLGFKVARVVRVGYWWQDDSTREELERIRVFEAAHGNPAGLPLHWFLNVGLQLPRDLARLRATVDEHQLELVIADSFYNVAGDTDLKDAGAEQIVARLKSEIADPTGAAVLIVDHLPWATEANRQRLRAYGGVFKNAATRFGIYVDAVGDKLQVEVRGNNIAGFRKRAAYFDSDTLELRLLDATDHDENVERRAELALALLIERGESLTTTALRKELGGRENITDEALQLLRDRAEVFDHGRDLGPWSGKNGAARYWIASVHAASRGIGTTAHLFGPGSAEARPAGPEDEPRPGPYKGAEVGRALVEPETDDELDQAEYDRYAALADEPDPGGGSMTSDAPRYSPASEVDFPGVRRTTVWESWACG